MTQFLRSYEIVVGRPFDLSPDTFSSSTSQQTKFREVDSYLQQDSPTNAYIIKDLNMTFSVDRTGGDSTTTDTATITIYNLSDDIVKTLQIYNKQFPTISLKAGYEDSQKTIFKGVVEAYTDSFEGSDRVTVLKLSDGGQQIRQAQTSRYYAKGTSVDSIVKDLLRDVGLPFNEQEWIYFDQQYVTSPTYFSGRTSKALHQLAKDYGGNFTIQNMSSMFVPHGEYIEANGVEPISEDNGLIGSVVAEEDITGTSSDPSNPPPIRVRFKTLLDGDLLPNYGIVLNSRNYKGKFKIISVKHAGTYEGNDWYSECVAERIE